MQENKPVLELKNTKEKVCQKLKLKKNIFHCALMIMYAIMHDQHSVHSYDQHIIAMINSLS